MPGRSGWRRCRYRGFVARRGWNRGCAGCQRGFLRGRPCGRRAGGPFRLPYYLLRHLHLLRSQESLFLSTLLRPTLSLLCGKVYRAPGSPRYLAYIKPRLSVYEGLAPSLEFSTSNSRDEGLGLDLRRPFGRSNSMCHPLVSGVTINQPRLWRFWAD